MANESAIIEQLKKCKLDRHTTLYCGPATGNRLLSNVAGGTALPTHTIDSGTVYGITIETIPELRGRTPILCKKGDVFPLAGDYYD
jgi:hypothetical protein